MHIDGFAAAFPVGGLFFHVPVRVAWGAFCPLSVLRVFFFNVPAPTEIYTLSLHDALPISTPSGWPARATSRSSRCRTWSRDRKSTRLNSSHTVISYAVFCLKKKKRR